MIFTTEYNQFKTLDFCHQWNIPAIVDKETATIIAVTDRITMKKFNGFLCHNKLDPFRILNFVNLEDAIK